MAKAIQIYGIKNCDTVRKALKWLEQNSLEIEFHDFKKESLTTELVTQWFSQVDASKLINRRGTTWRKLDDASKNLTEISDLTQLIIDNPSIVKRPILLSNEGWSVGFNADDWQQKLL